MLSAIAPSNRLTLGNYIGALGNWLKLQDKHDYDCIFFIVDLHAITVRQDAETLRRTILLGACALHGRRLGPEQGHALRAIACPPTCGARVGFELLHLHGRAWPHDTIQRQVRQAGREHRRRHIQLSDAHGCGYSALPHESRPRRRRPEATPGNHPRHRDSDGNNAYGKDLFTVPEVEHPPVGARIMSLQDPSAKMSKSDADPNASVFLSDTNDQIIKKLKRAVTDSGSEITYDDSKPGVKNLLTIQSALTGKSTADLVASYSGKQYGHLKVDTAEIVASVIGPIRDRATEFMKDRAELDRC